jgi:lipid-A-disaccharide synthase
MANERGDRPAVMVVAGEASGDLHAAALCRALTRQAPDARLFGLGGPAMAAAGVELLGDIRETAVIGFTEVVRRLPALRRLFGRLVDALTTRRPDALVLVDYPGLNLRLAAAARRAGVPVVYFVPPQVWAWGSGRLRAIRESVTLVLAVFEFEAVMYRAAGVPVEFIGHPAVDALASAPSRDEARRTLGLGRDDLVVGLLPGSRPHEIERMTPLLAGGAAGIAAAHPEARFLLALAPGIVGDAVAPHLPACPSVELVSGGGHAVMRAADLLLVTSGTATFEAALLGTPMVVCYRMSWASERISARLLRIPWVALANIVAGRPVVPELIRRRDATPQRLAREALALLDTPGALAAQRDAFQEVAAGAGTPGVAMRAARHVLSVAGVPAANAPATALA